MTSHYWPSLDTHRKKGFLIRNIFRSFEIILTKMVLKSPNWIHTNEWKFWYKVENNYDEVCFKLGCHSPFQHTFSIVQQMHRTVEKARIDSKWQQAIHHLNFHSWDPLNVFLWWLCWKARSLLQAAFAPVDLCWT